MSIASSAHSDLRGPKGKWGPTIRIVRNPRLAFEDWVAEYGDPFLVNALNGPIVVTGRADLIKQIFGEDPDTYSPFAVETVRPVMGAGSLILMEGAEHKRERRMLTPMFHGDRMKAYGESMKQVALEQVAKRAAQASFLTLPMMTAISLEIIVRTIFGGDKPEAIRRLQHSGSDLAATSNPILFFSKRMQFPFAGLSPWDRFRKARQTLYQALDEVIDQREKSGRAGEDILSMLMQAEYEDGTHATREHIREQLMTFLFAGHETSALTMTWAIYHLHANPRTLQSLKAELTAAGDCSAVELSQLPYLKAVVQETLRLNPLVTEVLRLLKRPMKLGDHELKPGMGVAAAAILAHYNPETYPNPNEFRPERFLERSFSPFEYLPFGGGHRRCIGATFATFETAIVLGAMLSRYEFELLETKPVVAKRRNVTLGPSTGVRIKCRYI